MQKLKNMFLKIWSKIDKFVLVIFIVSLFIFGSNIFGGYHLGHDTQIHLSNLEAWISNFKISDIFPSKIVPIVGNDFGYGTGIFYPPFGEWLTIYVFKIVSLFGFGIFFAIKVSYLIGMFLSGLFMYYFVKKVFKNNYVALVAAVFYMTFPYHILDIFTRDAISESYLFMFIPLIFLGIEYLFENNKKMFYLCFVSGYVGALFSHLVLSVYLTIFVLIYLFCRYKDTFKKTNIISFLIASLFILIFSSPFIVPLAEHMMFGNYSVFTPNYMYSVSSVLDSTVNLTELFQIPQKGDYTYLTIGFIPLICIITLCVCGYKKVSNKKLFNSFILLTIISFIMITKFFPWGYMPNFLLNIQFTWRIEMFLAFFMSVIGGLIVVLVKKDNQKILATVLVILSTMTGIYLVNVHDYGPFDRSGINPKEHGMGWQKEYLPVKAPHDYSVLDSRTHDIIIKKGEAKISDLKSDTPNLSFKTETDGATLELPRLYYFGYDIKLDGKKVNYKESDDGFILINIKKSGNVTVRYNGTLAYKISLIFCIIAATYAIIYFYKQRGKK